MNQKKKICYVTTIASTLESFVLPVAEYLTEHTDFEIYMICSGDESFQKKLPKGVKYIPVTMKRGISFDGISAMFQMIKIFKREKFDLVQYSTPNASLYASLAAKIAGIPVRLYCQWGIAYVGFSGLKRKIFKTIEKTVCSLSTWIEPDSFGNLKFSHMEGLYPEEKGSVIWNGSASGVSLKKFNFSHKEEWRKKKRKELGIPEDAFVYGFIGRITGDKGINELFEAFQSILEKNPDTYLILVGNAEKSESVNPDLYAWAKDEKHVIFCGYSNVVEQYVSAMDVYVLPSYREGFGSAVVEAEAMGVPVIVTNIPGPTDAMIKDKTGLVVEKADVLSLQKAMEQTYSDKSLYSLLGTAGEKFARECFEQQKLFEYILEDRKGLLQIKD